MLSSAKAYLRDFIAQAGGSGVGEPSDMEGFE
jgi:hypothetical protein